MQSITTQKRQLRSAMNARRKTLTRQEWERMSHAICMRIIDVPCFQEADTILVYVSSKDNEVDTRVIIETACEKGKQVLMPVIGAEKGEMFWVTLTDMNALVPGRFGLLEPAPGKTSIMPVPEKGMCLVPGIAFTHEGWRLGYGGGYYDRFLDGFQGISIGLAFEMQLVSWLPCDEKDRPVEFLATEVGWYPAVP